MNWIGAGEDARGGGCGRPGFALLLFDLEFLAEEDDRGAGVFYPGEDW